MDRQNYPQQDHLSFLPTYSTAVSDGVYKFINGAMFGSIWGLVTPFHAPGSVGAVQEMKTGVFKAAPPFSSYQSVFSNAMIVGSLMGIYGWSCSTCEVVRRKSDIWNSVFACGTTFSYYKVFLGSNNEKRLIWHNRTVGAAILSSLVYANLMK